MLKDYASKLDAKTGGHEAQELLADFQRVDFKRPLGQPTSDVFADYFDDGSRPSALALIPLLGILALIPATLAAPWVSRAKLWLLRNPEVREAPRLWIIWTLVGTLGIATLVYAMYLHGPSFLTNMGIPSTDTYGQSGWFTFAGGVMGITSLIFLPRRGDRPLAAFCLAIGVFSLAYFGQVLITLRQDQTLKKLIRDLPKETDTLRGNWQ
jgi:hypothetical protein